MCAPKNEFEDEMQFQDSTMRFRGLTIGSFLCFPLPESSSKLLQHVGDLFFQTSTRVQQGIAGLLVGG
jgi:hypothetical protein